MTVNPDLRKDELGFEGIAKFKKRIPIQSKLARISNDEIFFIKSNLFCFETVSTVSIMLGSKVKSNELLMRELYQKIRKTLIFHMSKDR